MNGRKEAGWISKSFSFFYLGRHSNHAARLAALRAAQAKANAAAEAEAARPRRPPVGAKKRAIAGEEWELMFRDIQSAAEALKDPSVNLRRATAVRRAVSDWIAAFRSAENKDLEALLAKSRPPSSSETGS
jgi:hypothetical protein